MTVLLVDDQINILSGLISGINWDDLNITAIRTAGNAAQAKKILQAEQIDILLCDIEMPGENGLSLLRWARKEGMQFICIFLTSHADFMYAKEAIQLNCFDYILQPARYEDIHTVIAKSINRIKRENAEKELEQYGAIAKSHSSGLFQNLFNDWIAGKELPVPALCNSLKMLGQNVQHANDCFVILGHLLRWHAEPWPAHEWVHTLNNIITEVYEENYGIVSFSIDHTSMGWLVYSLSDHFDDFAISRNPLDRAYAVLSAHMPCDLAFYLSPVVPLSQINALPERLFRAKKDNILQTSGIFPVEHTKTLRHFTRTIDTIQLRRWGTLLAEENGLVVCSEIFRFFDDATSKKQTDHEFLRNFWMQFQQIVLNALWELGRKTEEIAPSLNQAENAASLSEMRKAVKEITAYFQKEEKSLNKETKITDHVKRYLDNNIDQPLTVGDIALSLCINPDYLSRLFKNEYGITLKEYILKRKMEAAQSLLQTTTLPISIVASKLGYDNFSYFSQAYRRVMGVSPTDERKR